jgi:hypothetical protein
MIRTRRACIGAAAAVAALVYWRVLRPWQRHWGAAGDEIARAMPGDEWVSNPQYQTTMAISIRAAPSEVWPWLAQLGKGRGGLYSYDALDRLFGFLDAPSADRILPQYQQIKAGDVIPIGRGRPFPVEYVDPPRALVLAGEEGSVRWTWQFGLYEGPPNTTRLLSRNRVAAGAGIGGRLMPVFIETPAFLMTRAMLKGIRRRAERAPASALSAPDQSAPAASTRAPSPG